MKHTNFNDPFDYDEYKDESFWDFSWKNDWMTVVGVALMIAVCTIILYGLILASV